MVPNSNTVNILRFEPVIHVNETFKLAITLANGSPVDAGGLIAAMLNLSRTTYSEAFSKLASFFPSWEKESTIIISQPNRVLEEVSLSPAMFRSFSIAEPFLLEAKSIWGRHLVTVVLLATDDPSLDSMVKTSKTTLKKLREEWFDFVVSTTDHGSNEYWAAWWEKAGVWEPEMQRKAVKKAAGKGNGIVKTYLLTWDPKRHREDLFKESIEKLQKNGFVEMQWSVGNQGIDKNDRVFLMRHSEDRPGLTGVGTVVSDITIGPHWDLAKPSSMRTYYATIKWDVLSQYPVVSLDQLIKSTGEKSLWTTQGSGLPISREITEKIEMLWKKGPPVDSATFPGLPMQNRLPDVWMLSDRPLENDFKEQDSFQFSDYADALAAVLDHNKTDTPLTMAINAPWGAGKTTLANMLADQLKQRAKARGQTLPVICWFNAWMHDDAPNIATAFVSQVSRTADRNRPLLLRIFNPLPAELLDPAKRRMRAFFKVGLFLLTAIPLLWLLCIHLQNIEQYKSGRKEVKEDFQTIEQVLKSKSLKDTTSTNISTYTTSRSGSHIPGDTIKLNEVDKILYKIQTHIIVLSAFLAAISGIIGILIKILFSTSSLGGFVKAPENAAVTGTIQLAEKQLKKLISQATLSNNRFVVFVDDIERCRTPRSIDILDAVNQLMNHKNVIVIFLGDMPAIAAAAQIKYKELAEIFVPSAGVTISGPDHGKEAFGRLYLQKIIQFQFNLPTPHPNKIQAYMNKMADKAKIKEGSHEKV